MNNKQESNAMMSNKQFQQELNYQISMNLFSSMLEKNLITKEQYIIIDEKMKEKYKPIMGSLIVSNSLT